MSVASLAASFVSVAVFGPLTFLNVWLWEGEGAWSWALQFASGVMGILLIHELGHYIVARAHGIDRSPPYFIPLPLGFGTLGAIIHLRTRPQTRSGLLEMGAAGPLAGFVASIVAMAMGLPGTIEKSRADIEGGPSFLASLANWVDIPPTWLAWLHSVFGPDELQIGILANPLLMDILGQVINGEAPSRYAELHPLTLAGWLGCHLTAMNLIPAGQLDGGHIFSALWPKAARGFTNLCIGLLVLASLWWTTWIVWALLLARTSAGDSLTLSGEGEITRRAGWMAAACLLAFVLCLMPAPVQTEVLSVVSP